MVTRLNPDCLATPNGDDETIRKFIESDFKIRSGTCPNGCGLMREIGYGQECSACGFSCNTKQDKENPQ